MARSYDSSRYTSTSISRSNTFAWPEYQVYFWDLVMLAAAATIMGVFAEFIEIQNRMLLGVPWLFPYGVTVGAIAIVIILIQIVLLSFGRLQPGLMIIFSFVLFVLFLTGLIDTAIQLFGPSNVSSNCQVYVNNDNVYGVSVNTLAWLEQNNICSCWYAAFSFWLVGCVFCVWMLIMAAQVGSGQFE